MEVFPGPDDIKKEYLMTYQSELADFAETMMLQTQRAGGIIEQDKPVPGFHLNLLFELIKSKCKYESRNDEDRILTEKELVSIAENIYYEPTQRRKCIESAMEDLYSMAAEGEIREKLIDCIERFGGNGRVFEMARGVRNKTMRIINLMDFDEDAGKVAY